MIQSISLKDMIHIAIQTHLSEEPMEFKKAELKKYLECAKIVNTHGVNGTVKLENRADDPYVLSKLKTLYKKEENSYIPMKVLRASVQKNMVLATIEGIDTVEKAIALKNTVLYADRADFKLGRGDYFIADIIGLDVYDINKENAVVGTLHEVLSPAGQQVYVIKKKNGKTFMVPCVPEFIVKVSLGEDCDAGIYVNLIEGMDDTDEN